MIQRVQSILLALTAVTIALLFRFPISTYVAEPGIQNYTVNAKLNLIPQAAPTMNDQILAGSGTVNMDPSLGNVQTWPMIVLALLVAALSLAAIFMYKNRVLQLRVVAFAFLLNVIYEGLIFLFYVDKFGKGVETFANSLQCGVTHTAYAAGTWIPIASIVLLFLAQRAIRKDEMKVRAADRLR